MRSARGTILSAGLVAALIGLPFVVFEPTSTDLAAQTFRADLWRDHGWVLWSPAWYSGHLVPGYSLVYPPLGALFGPHFVGFVSAVVGAMLFAGIVAREPGRWASLGSLWFAAGISASLYSGRITYGLGVTLGLGALYVARMSPITAGLLAGAAGAASPVAGAFTALAGAAMFLAGNRREGLPILLGATLLTLGLSLAFPTAGSQPFEISNSWPDLAIVLVLFLLVPREMRALRIGVGLYALLVVALLVVPTPVGNNVLRLGALFAGPIAMVVLGDRRPRVLALVALPLLYWQLMPPVRDLTRSLGDPEATEAFYAPLLAQLEMRVGSRPTRVEVPPTQDRWESVYVGERFPLARGWLRQLETGDFPEFVDGRLTGAGYRTWLSRHGVSWVALPKADLDPISDQEADLLRSGLPYLKQVFADDNWRLWRVKLPPRAAPGAPLATNGARVESLGPDRFTVRLPRPGSYKVKLAWTPYLQADDPSICMTKSEDGQTEIVVPQDSQGSVTSVISARVSLDGLERLDPGCG